MIDEGDKKFFLSLLKIILIGFIFIVLNVFLLTNISSNCIEYKDLCYKKVLVGGKVVMDKPTSCSDEDVKGHKTFYTEYSKGYLEKLFIKK